MTNLAERSAVVTGGGGSVGRATVLALAAEGARVWAVGRDRARLEAVAREAAAPIEVRPLDAGDGAAMGRLLDEAAPSLVVLSAGARPRLAPVDEHTWESFSEPWNTDVKIAFQVGQEALRRPLARGSLVILVSSGAAIGGSPLSGGYAGAKRMMMFLAGYLQKAGDAKQRGVRFVTVVPKQLIAGTPVAEEAGSAYAAQAGISREKFMERFGEPLSPEGVARCIVQIAKGEIADGAAVVGVTGKGIELL